MIIKENIATIKCKVKDCLRKFFVLRFIIFIFVILGVFFMVVILHNNNPSGTNIYPPCCFKEITKLKCPGCGTARAMHNLLNGKIITALKHNFLTVIFIPFLAYSLFHQLLSFLLWKKLKKYIYIID